LIKLIARYWLSISAAAAGLGLGCDHATSPAQGSGLNGRMVAITHFHGTAPDMTTVFGPVNSVVGLGIELPNFGAVIFVLGQPTQGFVDIDLSDQNVSITATRDQPTGYFEVLRFSDPSQTIPQFTRVDINPATNWSGLDASDVFVAADYFQVNLTALHGLQGQTISLDITFDDSGG
jgi:hypothetical protein